MNRRMFSRISIGGLGALWLGPSRTHPPRQQLAVNGDRLLRGLQDLAELGKTAAGGISRVAFSDADKAGRAYILGLMTAADLDTEIDAAGNLLGRRAGAVAALPPLQFGSHIDSVPSGGNFDGPVGSISAVEVAQTLADQRIQTRHPLEVAIFSNEEGGKTGSRAISGEVTSAELELVTASGKTIGEGIAFIGGDPSKLEAVKRSRGDIAAYLELHVEQGGVLEKQDIDIGVVEGIVGIKRWNVTIMGFANHAGTTPMDQRRDALVAAARFIGAVNRAARERPGNHVATVGRIEAEPGAPNVIPGRVTVSLEIRDLDMGRIDQLFDEIRSAGQEIGVETVTTFSFEQFYVSQAAPTDRDLRDIIERVAHDLGLTTLRMPSGAGHDAQSIALLAPVGMIFVPSSRGISHSPKEFSSPNDVVNGANVLLDTLLAVDAAG